MNFEEARRKILIILRNEGKSKNSDMIQVLEGDVALFEQVREDLIFNDLAEDKKGVGLIYIGPSTTAQEKEAGKFVSEQIANEIPLSTNTVQPRVREIQRNTPPTTVTAPINRVGNVEIPEKPQLPQNESNIRQTGREDIHKRTEPPERGNLDRSISTNEDINPERSNRFLPHEKVDRSRPDDSGLIEKNGATDNPSSKKVTLWFLKTDAKTQNLALRLRRDLNQMGYKVSGDILPSQPDDILIMLLTPQSVIRPDGIYLETIQEARRLTCKIIFLMVEECHLPLLIFRQGWIDFRNWQEKEVYQQSFDQLVEALEDNLLLKSDYDPIFARLQPFDFGAQAVFLTKDFTGRDWLFEQINRWSRNEKSRVLFITGNPGIGKSSIIAQLVKKNPIVMAYHICSVRWLDTLAPIRFIRTIAAQLASQLDDYRHALEMQPLFSMNQEESEDYFAQIEPETLFRRLIVEPLTFERNPHPIMILVDSIDVSELENTEDDILGLLRTGIKQLPAWVKFIFTAIKGSRVIDRFGSTNLATIDLSGKQGFEDVYKYLKNKLQEDTYATRIPLDDLDAQKSISLVVKKSMGNFFHAVQALYAIELGYIDLRRPETFPNDVFTLIQTFFENKFPRTDYEPLRQIVDIMSAALEPLSEKQISEYLGQSIEHIQEIMEKVKPFFPQWDGFYQFSHSIIWEWFSGKAGKAHRYQVNELSGRRRIVKKLLLDFQAGKRDRHLLTILLPYLLGSQNLEEAERLVSSFAYIQAKCSAEMFTDLIEDYKTILGMLNRASFLKEQTLRHAQWLSIVRSTLQYIAPEINRDKSQLASQLVGRLLTFEKDERYGEFAAALLNEIRTLHTDAWLCPLLPTLTPPGGALIQTLTGYASKITMITLSHDGKRIISGMDDGTIKIRDLDRGAEIFTLVGHSKKVNSIAITEDGLRIVSASQDKSLKIWDLQTGKELDTLQGHAGYVNAVAICPDNKQIISASSDHTLKIWDIGSVSQKYLGNWQDLETLRGHTDSVEKVIISPDGKRAISASADKTIRVWDIENRKNLYTIRGHQSIITILGLTPDGRKIISSSIEDYSLKFWDIENGKLLYMLRGHTNSISGFAITPDCQRMVSSSGDKTIKIWHLNPESDNEILETGGMELFTLKGHTSHVRSVALIPDRRLVISGSTDKKIKVWDLISGNELRTLQGHTDGINTILVTPNGRQIVSASADNTIKVWDISYGLEACLNCDTQLSLVNGHSNSVNKILLAPDGWRAISASADGTLKFWSMISGFISGKAHLSLPGSESQIGKELSSITAAKDAILNITLTPDKRQIVAMGYGITVWEAESGKPASIKFNAPEWIYAGVITQDSHWLITGSYGHSLKVWEMQSGRYLGSLGSPQDRVSWVRAMITTQDGERVISAAQDKTIKIWDWKIGREVGMLRGHTGGVNAVILSPDGRQIISASDDGTIRLWDIESEHCTNILRGHLGAIRGLATTTDGKQIISASEDQTIKVWDVEKGRLLVNFTSDSKMHSCVITPDGTTIIAGGESGRVHFLLYEQPDSS